MAKKAKKSAKAKPKSKPKAKQKAVKKAKVRSKSSSVKQIKAKGQSYAAPPRDTLARPKSVTIPLEKTEEDYSTIPSFAPSIPVSSSQGGPSMALIAQTSSGIHSFGAVVFLLLAAVGYWFSLIFVSQSQWLSFLLSLAVMIICLDSFLASLYRRQEAKHPMEPSGMQNMHQLSMHVFLLLAIIAVVFSIAFWLQGKWIMLLLALGAAIVAFDNMFLAKGKHETH